MLPKASHRNAATLPGKTGILSCHTGKRAHRHRQKTGPDPHSRRAFPHDSCFQSRYALRPAVFSDRIVLSGEYRPENVPFRRMQAFWTTEQTVPPFQAGHFRATNETSGRHDAPFATVDFPPPFRHHRFSCFKANPGRQADHYNVDGIRCFRRFPACSALIVKIR